MDGKVVASVRSRVGSCNTSLIEVGCVDVKRDSNEASFYIQCFYFIFASIMCYIYSQYPLQDSDPIFIEILV